MHTRSALLTPITLLAVVFLNTTALTTLAQPTPVGSEFEVNTVTTGNQLASKVASDDQGNFIVVWQGPDQDSTGIFGQRHAFDGTPLSAEFQVNSTTTNSQDSPAVSSSALGDFVVVWSNRNTSSFYREILGQRYASDGTAQGGEFQISSSTTINYYSPDVSSDDSGNFVVTWTGNYYIDPVFVRPFASDGTPLKPPTPVGLNGARFQVETTDNGFVVVWGHSFSFEILARRFTSDGTALGGQFAVNTTDDAFAPDISSDADGDFIIVWSLPIGPDAIMARRLSSSGTLLGDEFQVNAGTTDLAGPPRVASDADGNFTVAWFSSGLDGDSGGIHGRRVASDGTFLGGDFPINSYTTGSQTAPSVASTPEGDLVVTWTGFDDDGTGIRGQLLSPDASADLAVTKDDGVTSVLPGAQVVYTIVASNNGPSDADPVTFTDMFPPELDCSWTSLAAGGATGQTSASGNLGDILTMPATSSVAYTVTCDVAIDATGTLSNTATIASALPDPAPGNNSATDDNTELRIADLTVTQSDNADPVLISSPVTYTIQVTNAGPTAADDVRLTSILPLGSSLVTATGSGWICNGMGIITVCGLAQLDVGAAPAVTITLTAPATGGEISHQVVVSAVELDPNPDDNLVEETTMVFETLIFADGFESGNTMTWTASTP